LSVVATRYTCLRKVKTGCNVLFVTKADANMSRLHKTQYVDVF